MNITERLFNTMVVVFLGFLCKGMQEGMQMGEQKKRQETARNMKPIGLQIEQIIQVTGLTTEEIERL